MIWLLVLVVVAVAGLVAIRRAGTQRRRFTTHHSIEPAVRSRLGRGMKETL